MAASDSTDLLPLRERNRLAAMNSIQDVAFELFLERGYNNVTVAEIAKAAAVSAMTIYRYFETKERLIVWDPHTEQIGPQVSNNLETYSAFEAIRMAFLEVIPPRYDDRQLQFVKLIYANPELLAVTNVTDHQLALRLARRIQDSGVGSLESDVLARTALAVLDAALFAWQQSDGVVPLDQLLVRAFGATSVWRPSSSQETGIGMPT